MADTKTAIEATKILNKEVAAARKAYTEAVAKAKTDREARIAKAYAAFAEATAK